MSDVLEQGATRRFRPSDFSGPVNWDNDRRRPSGLPNPKYGRSPPATRGGKWSPQTQPNPLRDVPIPKGVPRPAPRPHAPSPRPLPRPGRLPPGIGGRILPGIGIGLGIADMIDGFFKRPKLPEPNPANGWEVCNVCTNPPSPPDTAGPYKSCDTAPCISGQAGGGVLVPGSVVPLGERGLGYGHWKWTNPGAVPKTERYAHRKSWTRTRTARDKPQVVPYLIDYDLAPNPANLDPNLLRPLPSYPRNPFDDLPVTEPQTQVDPRLDPDGYNGREVIGDTVRPSKPTRRRPPRRRERQAKALGRSQKFMIALWSALDAISESAEVVDAVYDALPEKTKKRWKCPSRGLIDNAGQYGIDGADCKAKAIYHNAHSVDVEAAVENIIKNHLSDKFVGAMHRNMPRNLGNAVEDGEIALNKQIDKWLDDIIDMEHFR